MNIVKEKYKKEKKILYLLVNKIIKYFKEALFFTFFYVDLLFISLLSRNISIIIDIIIYNSFSYIKADIELNKIHNTENMRTKIKNL